MSHIKKYNNWPDAVRKKMIERSEFYTEPKIYHYGFYDAWQIQSQKIEKAIELIQKARSEQHPDALLQDAIITLFSDFPSPQTPQP